MTAPQNAVEGSHYNLQKPYEFPHHTHRHRSPSEDERCQETAIDSQEATSASFLPLVTGKAAAAKFSAEPSNSAASLASTASSTSSPGDRMPLSSSPNGALDSPPISKDPSFSFVDICGGVGDVYSKHRQQQLTQSGALSTKLSIQMSQSESLGHILSSHALCDSGQSQCLDGKSFSGRTPNVPTFSAAPMSYAGDSDYQNLSCQTSSHHKSRISHTEDDESSTASTRLPPGGNSSNCSAVSDSHESLQSSSTASTTASGYAIKRPSSSSAANVDSLHEILSLIKSAVEARGANSNGLGGDSKVSDVELLTSIAAAAAAATRECGQRQQGQSCPESTSPVWGSQLTSSKAPDAAKFCDSTEDFRVDSGGANAAHVGNAFKATASTLEGQWRPFTKTAASEIQYKLSPVRNQQAAANLSASLELSAEEASSSPHSSTVPNGVKGSYAATASGASAGFYTSPTSSSFFLRQGSSWTSSGAGCEIDGSWRSSSATGGALSTRGSCELQPSTNGASAPLLGLHQALNSETYVRNAAAISAAAAAPWGPESVDDKSFPSPPQRSTGADTTLPNSSSDSLSFSPFDSLGVLPFPYKLPLSGSQDVTPPTSDQGTATTVASATAQTGYKPTPVPIGSPRFFSYLRSLPPSDFRHLARCVARYRRNSRLGDAPSTIISINICGCTTPHPGPVTSTAFQNTYYTHTPGPRMPAMGVQDTNLSLMLVELHPDLDVVEFLDRRLPAVVRQQVGNRLDRNFVVQLNGISFLRGHLSNIWRIGNLPECTADDMRRLCSHPLYSHMLLDISSRHDVPVFRNLNLCPMQTTLATPAAVSATLCPTAAPTSAASASCLTPWFERTSSQSDDLIVRSEGVTTTGVTTPS